MRCLFLASTAIILATNGAACSRNEEIKFPLAHEVQSINVQWYRTYQVEKNGGYDVERLEFQARPEDWSAIRAALLPAKHDPNPSKWETLGQVNLTRKDGESLTVHLYYLGESPGAFSAGRSDESRVYFRGGDTSKLEEALEKSYQNSKEIQPD